MDEKLGHALTLLSYIRSVEFTIKSCSTRIKKDHELIEEYKKGIEDLKRKKSDAIRDLMDAKEALEKLINRVRKSAVRTQEDYKLMLFMTQIANASDSDREDATTAYRASEVINRYHFSQE